MGIGIGHFSRLAHVILQVLPADPGGQVLHYQAMLGAQWRTETGTSTTTFTVTTRSGTTGSSPGRFDGHSLTQQLFAIHLIDGIVRVTVIFELNKPVALFDQNLRNSSVAFEKAFQIALPDIIRKSADINTGTTHCFVKYLYRLY